VTDHLLGAIAAFGLPGSELPVLPEPLGKSRWSGLLYSAAAHGILGLLEAAVSGGALTVTSDQRQEVHEQHRESCVTALHLERELLRLHDEFVRANLDAIVLKGAAVARLAYPDPSLRLFADNDILVRADQYERVLSLLVESGYRRQTAEARAGFEREFGKGVTLSGPDGTELDLHRNLVFGTFGFMIDLDDLFRAAVKFDLGGQHLQALGPAHRLMHAIYHAALGDPRPKLSSIRDIAQMLAYGSVGGTELLRLARAWHAEAVLARGLSLCRTHLRFDQSEEWSIALGSYRPTRRESRAIASYVGSKRSFAAKVVASLPYVPGPRAKVRFLTTVVRPDPHFILSHDGRPGSAWLRRGVRSLVRGGGAVPPLRRDLLRASLGTQGTEEESLRGDVEHADRAG
jgi:hypothetical protein